jgi:glycosyltransferase involved in cell wall biosynthesis
LKNKTIHIVSLDVPFPPDYGCMIDVFYRIKVLHELGFSIILHTFTYGRGTPKELEKYCQKIYYYNRRKSIWDLFKKRPFIVQTRISNQLLNRLLADNYPILLEGTHCCWYLEHPAIQQRKTIVRMHNIEHDYYYELMKTARGLKKLFFFSEYVKLKRYESIVKKAPYILCVKKSDNDHYLQLNENTILMPSSLPEFAKNEIVELKDYCLFHGNLSIAENYLSAKWLLDKIIPNLNNIPFVIAGKNPSEALKKLAEKKRIELIESPSDEVMKKLIAEARIHVLPSTQDTGLKLKLFAVLQTSGTIIVNSNMIQGNGLKKYCIVADTAEEFVATIQQEYLKPIDLNERKERIESFLKETNTKALIIRTFREIGLLDFDDDKR